MILRNATSADIRTLYPQGMPYHIKAMVLEKDGVPIGIGGIVYRPEGGMIFLEDRDYADRGISRMAVARAIFNGFKKIIMPEIQTSFVYRDVSRPTSERLLKKLGFQCTFKETEGEIWQWLRH